MDNNSNDKPQIHEMLGFILTRPGMFVGPSDNIVESLWSFMSGFDCGLKNRDLNAECGELIPKDLLRFIQNDLNLQFNDTGIVPRLVEREGDPEAALAALCEIIGRFYDCTIDRESFGRKSIQGSDSK